MSTDDGERPKQDVVFVHSRAENGDGFRVIRKREETIEIGEMRSMPEGKPLHGEVVRLKPRAEHDRLFDVEVVLPKDRAASADAAGSRTGPAQVATDTYRENWDAIFGTRAPRSLPN